MYLRLLGILQTLFYITGLQAGTNRGANQSGQNFGAARKITDFGHR